MTDPVATRRPDPQLRAGGRATSDDPEAWQLLVAAWTLLRRKVDSALAPWGTTAAQAQVLFLIALAGRPLSVTELARAMLQANPSITRLVDRMTARGLVTRLSDPADRRLSLVAATDAGTVLFQQIGPPGSAAANEAFGVLSRRELDTLKRLLRKFTEAERHRSEST